MAQPVSLVARPRGDEYAKRKRLEAELVAELQAPLIATSPPHSLERIQALRPRWVADADAPTASKHR